MAQAILDRNSFDDKYTISCTNFEKRENMCSGTCYVLTFGEPKKGTFVALSALHVRFKLGESHPAVAHCAEREEQSNRPENAFGDRLAVLDHSSFP